MRPRVLYVTPMFGYPPLGGPRLRTYYTLRALARWADVTLYVTQQPDTRDRATARTHMLTFCADVVLPAAAPAAPTSNSVARRIARRLRLRQALRAFTPHGALPTDDVHKIDELAEWISANDPDVIWLGFGGISYELTRLKHLTGKPLVLETECVWSRFVLRELPFVRDPRQHERIVREGRAKEAEELEAAPYIDITTAVSEVDAAYFRSLVDDPARVMLLHNVIDVRAYQSAARVELEQPALLFAGSLSRGTANVDAALWLLDKIMPRVWHARPDAHVYLVGRDPAPEVRHKNGGHVHVTGEVPSIVPYLRASAAALVPLRWESGTRFKILEAFAARTPVVSTALGAEGLAVEHGRHLLIADQPTAFATAVVATLDDPSLRQRLVEPAFDLVQHEYDVSSAERQIADILGALGWPTATTHSAAHSA